MSNLEETVFLKITDFLRAIHVPIRFCSVAQTTFLPGLMIENGTLLIDKNQLKYIGDTLHEAGHIALMPPEERNTLSGNLEGQTHAEATEMAVIAWTYAACLEIGIDPAVVFHPEGYKGGSESILSNFGEGRYFGVPILQWFGMTYDTKNALENNIQPYPKMTHWVR
jgi:hypothetical protein